MAAWLELLKRLEETVYKDARLHAECVYRGAGLPEWLHGPFDIAAKNAGDRTPVLLLNVKGRTVGDTLCLLRLRDLEALVRHDNP